MRNILSGNQPGYGLIHLVTVIPHDSFHPCHRLWQLDIGTMVFLARRLFIMGTVHVHLTSLTRTEYLMGMVYTLLHVRSTSWGSYTTVTLQALPCDLKPQSLTYSIVGSAVAVVPCLDLVSCRGANLLTCAHAVLADYAYG